MDKNQIAEKSITEKLKEARAQETCFTMQSNMVSDYQTLTNDNENGQNTELGRKLMRTYDVDEGDEKRQIMEEDVEQNANQNEEQHQQIYLIGPCPPGSQ